MDPFKSEEKTIKVANGAVVTDQFRVLEEPDHELTKQFCTEARDEFDQYINETTELRDTLKAEIESNFHYPKTSTPTLKGEYYYIYHNRGLENQNVLYRIPAAGGMDAVRAFDPDTAEEYINLNKENPEGTTAMKASAFQKGDDPKVWAYGTSDKGSDWVSFHFMDVTTLEKLPDVIDHAKFSDVQWSPDNKGVFYAGYGNVEISGSKGTETTKQEYHRAFYHTLGTSQSDDQLVFSMDLNDPEQADWMGSVYSLKKLDYIIGYISRGCEPKNLLFFKETGKILDGNANAFTGWKPIIAEWDAEYSVVYGEGSTVIVKTNKDADNQKIIQMDLSHEDPLKTSITLMAEKNVPIDDVDVINGKVFITYLEDVQSRCYMYEWDREVGALSGKFLISPPDMEVFSTSTRGNEEKNECYVSFTNQVNPGSTFKFDTEKKSLEFIRSPKLPDSAPDLDRFMAEQLWFHSKDDTRVPMFVTREKGDQAKKGPMPVLLYGYGGFNISLEPGFSINRLPLISRGVLHVIVNLRGGGEFGEKWHEGGMRDNKQNVFDDFIAAAEHLIKIGYTTPEQIVIMGGSNGGTLVTAVANQRPDLFAGIVSQVPVTDMMKFHKFTIGYAWVPEFGNPEAAEDVPFLLKYSPLHTIPSSGKYPATLITTGDHDDRVVPLHSLKFFAQLKDNLGAVEGQNPLLLRVDIDAGHGAGKPISKSHEETADTYTFFLRTVKHSAAK